MRCVQCIKTLLWGNETQLLDNFSKFSPYGGTLRGGGQNFRQVEDRVKNLKEKLFRNEHDKTNIKMGGRSLRDNFWLYGSPLQDKKYYTVSYI